jgi:hypothetical protein
MTAFGLPPRRSTIQTESELVIMSNFHQKLFAALLLTPCFVGCDDPAYAHAIVDDDGEVAPEDEAEPAESRAHSAGAVDDLADGLDPQLSAGKAMTWGKISHNNTLGVDLVGCANCNAYAGDTSCTAFLPVLCIRQDGSPKPSGLATDFHNGWTGGHIATTHAIQGTTLTSLQVANQLCVDNFGAGWRMAEFHDGKGGWNWYAFGNARQDTRMWVSINDQPSNCWNP